MIFLLKFFSKLINNEKSIFFSIWIQSDYFVANGIDTIFGKIINIQKQIGQGGNYMVCFGKLNDEDVAVKILINYNEDKKIDFI